MNRIGELSMSVSFSLQNRTFLVTGSTTGLGKAMAHALGAAGARVAMNYQNNTERAEAAFGDFQAAGYEGALFRASVIDPDHRPTTCSISGNGAVLDTGFWEYMRRLETFKEV